MNTRVEVLVLLQVLSLHDILYTAHTQVGRPTREAPTREYTHKHKHSPRYIYIRWEGEYINTPEGCQRCANAAHTLKCTTG